MEKDGDYDFNFEPWNTTANDEKMSRMIHFKSPINTINPLITVSFAECHENVLVERNGDNYQIKSSVTCPNVPFGTYFTTEYQYCLIPWRDEQDNTSGARLLIHAGLPFTKYTMFESRIKAESLKNIVIYFERFRSVLEKTLESKGKKLVDHLAPQQQNQSTGKKSSWFSV